MCSHKGGSGYHWSFCSVTVTPQERGPGVGSAPATHRQAGRHRHTMGHAHKVTCWPPHARQAGGVGGGESVITFLGQVRARPFPCRFCTTDTDREKTGKAVATFWPGPEGSRGPCPAPPAPHPAPSGQDGRVALSVVGVQVHLEVQPLLNTRGQGHVLPSGLHPGGGGTEEVSLVTSREGRAPRPPHRGPLHPQQRQSSLHLGPTATASSPQAPDSPWESYGKQPRRQGSTGTGK